MRLSEAQPESALPAEAINNPTGSAPAGQSAGTELNEFLDYARVEKGLAANSIESYRRDLVEFAGYLKRGHKTLGKVRREDIRDFLATLYRRGLGGRSAAAHGA